jgi:methylated-DNA-[protein]-cysteine S-methyltransferase
MQTNSLPYSIIIDSPIGKLGIKLQDDQLSNIDFLPKQKNLTTPTSALTKTIIKQLENYFTNPKFIFNLPLHIIGTPFQRQVWEIMREIPLGKTLSYGAVAERLNSSPRAIGNACRTNPIPVVIPCHRIVAKHGIGGFSGAIQGPCISMKEWLLRHEGVFSIKQH